LLVVGAMVLGPLLAYWVGRVRATQRSEAAREYYVAEQRPAAVAYYQLGLVALVVLTAGAGLCIWLGRSVATVLLLILVVGPAGALLVMLGLFGLTMIGGFVIGGKEPVPGYCTKCDYDLRGIADGRCPECGHVMGVRMTKRSAPAVEAPQMPEHSLE